MEAFLFLTGLGLMAFLVLLGVAINQWVEHQKSPSEEED